MNDMIYREDAIDELMHIIPYKLYHNGEYVFLLNKRECLKVIKAVSSADRPQGEWIRDRYWSRGVGMGEEYGFFYKCSMCEYEVEDGYTRCGFNFCPYCGADMRKGADDE